MAYKVYWRGTVAYAVFEHELTDIDLLNANREISDSPLCERMTGQIFDASAVTRVSVSNDAIWAVARMDTEFARTHPRVTVAVVATTPLQIGLTRMYELAAPDLPWAVLPVQTREEAEQAVQAEPVA